MNKKIQAATEYLMIVGFVIVILIPGIYLYMKYSQESQDSIINAKVDSITNEIVKAAEQVYTYGEGSQTTINIDLPKNVVAISFQGNEIVFTVINSKGGQSEIAKVASVNLIGDITLLPGTKKINIKSLGDTVSVFIECSEGVNRCGFEWECARYIGGDYTEGQGCKMLCENNQWKYNGEKCTDGCNNGICIECDEGQTKCEGANVMLCQDGAWIIDEECTGGTPICLNGACVACNEGQTKCGSELECGDYFPCIMECNANNIWVKGPQCKDLTPSCQNGICVICADGERRCGIDGECSPDRPCVMECETQIWEKVEDCRGIDPICKDSICECTIIGDTICGREDECTELLPFECILQCQQGTDLEKEWKPTISCNKNLEGKTHCTDTPPPATCVEPTGS